MKKTNLLTTTLLSLTLFTMVTLPVSAANIIEQMQKSLDNSALSLPKANPSGGDIDTATQKIIGNGINIFLGLFGVIFLILMVYGGYKWMNARGNENELDTAKSIIRSAIIGFVIVMLAYAISTFVTGALQGLVKAA